MDINQDLIGKLYKDPKSKQVFEVIRGYKIVDDQGNTDRVFYKAVGVIGGVPSVHCDVSQTTIQRNLIIK